MKKQIIFFPILALTLAYCATEKEDPKRWAFLFQLGSGRTEILKGIRGLIELGGLKRLGQKEYYWSSDIDHRNYHYAPLFFFQPGDTVCSEMRLVFFDDLDVAEIDIETARRDEVSMNLMTYDPQRISSQDLRDHTIRELESRYGPYTGVDTISFEETELEKVTWNDKKGVDITVRYRYTKNKWQPSPFSGNSSLIVSYAYTNEMKQKLFKPTENF